MARRPLRDPISSLISDMSRAIIGTAANFQDNVSDVTEGITQQVTNTVAAESIPTLTSQIRRTLSGSRTRPSAGTGPLPLNGTASPPPNPPVDPPDNPQAETLDEGARRRAAETAEIVNSIPGFGAGGNRIPPVDPPGPPDPPDDDDPDDENDLFRRFTEWLQRFTGVMPDPREFDTLLNNVTDVLGGQPAQPDDPTRPSPLAGFMTAFSDYFNTPQLSPEAQIRAEQDLTEAVEELTNAVTGNTRTRSGTTPRANRVTNWIRRRAQHAVVRTARVLARIGRPFARGVSNLIPQNIRTRMTQFGAQVIGQQARNLGVPAGTAARFGATLGPAAALVGGAMIGISFIRPVIGMLNEWAKEGLEKINRVAQYNGDLFSGQKTLEMGRLQRDIAAANISGSSGRARFEAENDAEQSWAPWENFKTGVGNMWGTGTASASGLMGDVVNQSMAAVPRIVELLGYLSNLESIQRFGQKAIDFWVGNNGGNADLYRSSAMGAWVSEEANGQAAQDQRRRARRPLGPQP